MVSTVNAPREVRMGSVERRPTRTNARHDSTKAKRMWGVQPRIDLGSLAYDAQVRLAHDLGQRVRLLAVVVEHDVLA